MSEAFLETQVKNEAFLVPRLRCVCSTDHQTKRYCHVACLVKGKRIINIAKNDYTRQFSGGQLNTSLHAEINCVKQVRDLKNYRLIVLRFTSDGKLRDSKPCHSCKMYLMNRGLSHVFCSTENGVIQKLRLESIIAYQSPAQKKFTKKQQNQ